MRANQILGTIKRNFLHLDKSTLPLLFKALVRPHLEYGNEIWGPFNKADQLLVERVQRRATRLIPSLAGLEYEERLRQLKLPSLEYRRRRGDMILMYKIMHGRHGIVREELFQEPSYAATRGHQYKVFIPDAVKRARKNHLAIRALEDWNRLPSSVVEAPSTDCFKNYLDDHWAELLYRPVT